MKGRLMSRTTNQVMAAVALIAILFLAALVWWPVAPIGDPGLKAY